MPQDDLALALVGTRAASYYGLKTCRRLAGALALRGVTVVSGLARGIDTAAHQGALENSGRTLAVLGCGLDVVYRPENHKLYEQIPEQGALISEFLLGTPPEARIFPSATASSAACPWGWWWWRRARRAAPPSPPATPWTGPGVLAVPVPVDSPTSLGPHRLIQDGAKLIQDLEDIFQELPGLKQGQRRLFAPPAGSAKPRHRGQALHPSLLPSPPRPRRRKTRY